MQKIERQYIDWEKTGRNLQLLRADNLTLRKNVCYAIKYAKGDCAGDCDHCRYDMDMNISRAELARVFNVSENVVANWESGRTQVGLEDMLFYCRIAGVTLDDIIEYT